MRLLRPDPHTLSGAYAVNAIDPAERERFERHLASCPSCAHEVAGLRETATRLALAVARVPPPEMKAAVLGTAAQTRQYPPLVAHPERGARHRSGRAAIPKIPRPRLAVAFAAVAAALVIALGITAGVQHGQLDQARAQQQAVAAVLSAPDARLVSARTSLGGTATMVVTARLDKMVFTAQGLPALASARVYQLWLLTPSGGAISSGFLPGAVGGRTAPVLSAGPPSGDRVAVTVEPAGGSRQPTTRPIVVLSIPS